jgi:hypothetical protein
MIVAGLSGLSFSEGFAKIPNHDGTRLRFARDSLLEGTGFEPSVPEQDDRRYSPRPNQHRPPLYSACRPASISMRSCDRLADG